MAEANDPADERKIGGENKGISHALLLRVILIFNFSPYKMGKRNNGHNTHTHTQHVVWAGQKLNLYLYYTLVG